MVSKRSLRWQENDASTLGAEPTEALCPLCGRTLVAGPTVDEHHLVPRSQGGRMKETLHRVCHRKIHQTLKPRELARSFASWEALRAHPEIEKFIEWVRKRPPEFMG